VSTLVLPSTTDKKTDHRGMVNTVTVVIVFIFLVAGMMLIFYKLSSSIDLTENVLAVTEKMDNGVVFPELIINAGCISPQRGVISSQKFVKNYCGLDCLDLSKDVTIQLQSPILNKACATKDVDEIEWSRERSFWVTLINQSSGNTYPARLFIRS